MVDGLRQHFGERAAGGAETPSQYELSAVLEGVGWLREHLPSLAELLLPAGFRLTLEVVVADLKVALQFQRAGGHLTLIPEMAEAPTDTPTDDSEPEAVEALINFREALEQPEVELAKVLESLEQLAVGRVKFGLAIHLFLDKGTINSQVASNSPTSQRPKVVSFLFCESFMSSIETISPYDFEREFCQEGARTQLLVFDLDGGLNGDFLNVCGRGMGQEFEARNSTPLSMERLQNIKRSLDFRKSQSLGSFNTSWLLPDVFELVVQSSDLGAAQLKRQLQKFQALLCAIYLADFVEQRDGNFWVEYRGIGKASFPISYQDLLNCESNWSRLYELYQYAYDGLSADKLEIAQQFASLIAQDVGSLCSKATEIRDATKKTYDRALVDKVEDYFEARQSIQERIQTAVTEISNDAIGLGRDLSSDLYKVVGVSGLAIAGALFKTDVGMLAVAVGFLAVSVYFAVVVLYHLPTVKRAVGLRKSQHEAYIRSFSDVLGEGELGLFINNQNWIDARTMFSDKHWWAVVIYGLLLAVSTVIAIGFLILMWINFWAMPEVKPLVAHILTPESVSRAI